MRGLTGKGKRPDSDYPEWKRKRRSLVIIYGTSRWGTTKLAEHYVADCLRQSVDVLFVNPPFSKLSAHPCRSRYRGYRRPPVTRVDDGLYLFDPQVLPAKDRTVMVDITDHQIRRLVRGVVRAIDAPLAAMILTLPHRRLLDDRLPGLTVYWAKDHHLSGAQSYGMRPRRIERVEAELAERADLFLVASESLADSWKQRGAAPTVFPNGCDVVHLSSSQTTPAPHDLTEPKPRAIFVGTLGDRVDARYVHAVADRGVSVVLVGAERRGASWHELEDLCARDEIEHIGWRSYGQLPAYLGSATVGILPYSDNTYNRGSFPLKVLEYLGAGLPVVATDLPAVRWLDTNHVSIGSTPEDFAAAVVRLVEREPDPEAVAARQAFAESHSWDRRTQDLATLLGLATSRGVGQHPDQ